MLKLACNHDNHCNVKVVRLCGSNIAQSQLGISMNGIAIVSTDISMNDNIATLLDTNQIDQLIAELQTSNQKLKEYLALQLVKGK